MNCHTNAYPIKIYFQASPTLIAHPNRLFFVYTFSWQFKDKPSIHFPAQSIMINLAQYSLPELQQLQKDLADTIARRQIEDKKTTLEMLKQLAQERGFELGDLLGAGAAPRGKTKSAGVPLYRNPADASATWTGRGRKPQWVVDFLANGGQLDQLKI